MMRKVSKMATVFAMIAALGVGMAGCSVNTKTSGSSDDSAQDNTSTGDEKVITMWHIQTQDTVAKTIEDSMKRFEEANPGYKVDIVAMANDAYKTKLVTAMAAGELPDIFIHWTGGPMTSYVDADALYDLTDLMNADNYKDQFLDASIAQATYQDKIWAVPVENVSPALLYYNKEMFKEYDLNPPTTLDEFEQVCDTLLEKDVIPIALANKTKWTGSIIYGYILDRIAGAQAFEDGYNGEKSFTEDDYIKAAQKFQEWAEKGYFGDDFNALDYDSGQDRNLLYNDEAGMYIMGGWFLFTAQGEAPDYIDKIGIIQFPADTNGKGSAADYIGTIGDNFYSVAKSSKEPEMAFEAIKYLLDDTAVEERIAEGKIPPLKDIELTDDLSIAISDAAQSAEHMQLWLDQYLPNEQAEVHKDALQQLLDGSITPEEYGKMMDDTIADLK
ncbi:MAG: extracellular solute-binding protein [Dorea sp.]|nr:extracellular solute-binding protein [Dorea sp.]